MVLLFLLLAVLAGSLIPLQAGVNASLRAFMPHPVLAAVTNFVVGLTALTIVAIFMRTGLPASAQISKAPWWCWVGGTMGACLVLSGVFLSHRLGATTFFACVILGQVAASVVCDHFGLVGYSVHHVSWLRVGGLALLGGGVWLVRIS